jgi:hypothetical protein
MRNRLIWKTLYLLTLNPSGFAGIQLAHATGHDGVRLALAAFPRGAWEREKAHINQSIPES